MDWCFLTNAKSLCSVFGGGLGGVVKGGVGSKGGGLSQGISELMGEFIILDRFECIEGLAQDCNNSSALAMELLQSATETLHDLVPELSVNSFTCLMPHLAYMQISIDNSLYMYVFLHIWY